MADFLQQSSFPQDILDELNAAGGDGLSDLVPAAAITEANVPTISAAELATRIPAGSIVYDTVVVAATTTVETVAGLAFTPALVIYSQTADADGAFVWSTTGTTGDLVFTRLASTVATTITYIAFETLQA